MERGIIDFPRNDLAACTCGHYLDNISLGYGRTPYNFYCHNCATCWTNRVTNCDVNGAADAWNEFRKVSGDRSNPYKFKAVCFKKDK